MSSTTAVPATSTTAPTSATTSKAPKKARKRTREAVIRSLLTKIFIDEETGCWIWTGGRSSQYQYPYAWIENTARPVHRILYEYQFGELPKIAADGSRVELHHDREGTGCRGRASGCVAPSHQVAISAKQHGQITAMERALGIQSPKPARRPRRPRPARPVQVPAAGAAAMELEQEMELEYVQ